MKANPTKLANNLLKNLIRDTVSALDFIDALCDQADADSDESTASVLRKVCERLNHAAGELKTAETVMKAGGRSKRGARPCQPSHAVSDGLESAVANLR